MQVRHQIPSGRNFVPRRPHSSDRIGSGTPKVSAPWRGETLVENVQPRSTQAITVRTGALLRSAPRRLILLGLLPPYPSRQLAKILITDGDQRSSLAAVRSLGRAGHEVLVCSARKRSLAGDSRHARRTIQVPDVVRDVDAFESAVHAIATEASCDLVLPMTDLSMVALLGRDHHTEPEGRRRSYEFPLPCRSAYDRASDKAGLMDLAHAEGVPVPAQVVLRYRDVDAAAEFADTAGWPIVVKPSRSVVRCGPELVRTSVRIAADRSAVASALDAIPDEAFPVLIQHRIQGPGLGVFLLSIDGDVAAWFAHRRLREKPPTGGVSVYRESVPVRAELAEHCRKLVRRLDWTGVAMVEFKEDSVTGTPFLMEINARFWGSLQLAIDAGVDFPRLLADAILDGVAPSVETYRTGVRSRWFWGDVDHLLWMLRASAGYRSTYPQLSSRMAALGRFLVPWLPGDRWEVMRLSDFQPFVRETLTWFADLRG